MNIQQILHGKNSIYIYSYSDSKGGMNENEIDRLIKNFE